MMPLNRSLVAGLVGLLVGVAVGYVAFAGPVLVALVANYQLALLALFGAVFAIGIAAGRILGRPACAPPKFRGRFYSFDQAPLHVEAALRRAGRG